LPYIASNGRKDEVQNKIQANIWYIRASSELGCVLNLVDSSLCEVYLVSFYSLLRVFFFSLSDFERLISGEDWDWFT